MSVATPKRGKEREGGRGEKEREGGREGREGEGERPKVLSLCFLERCHSKEKPAILNTA